MGKKRVTYDSNDDKPSNQVVTDQHHHNHNHNHHRHQKPRKIKPEAKLLHTLNSHLKKLSKSRSRNTHSLSPPSTVATVSPESNKHRHGHLSSSLNHNQHNHDGSTGFDVEHEDAHQDGGDTGVFEFGQELSWKSMSFVVGSENCEDLFGGDCVFAPDMNATHHNMVVVFDEDGSDCGSYIPDPVMDLDNGDGGIYLYDILHLSSQEEMINEFLKVNLFVS